jgi:hypothetical protein
VDDERFQPDLPDLPDITLPSITWQFPPLPEWLARRHIMPVEHVTWVRGPRLNPWWERHVTHPALFLYAVALGAVCLTVGRLCAASWREMHPLPAVVAVVLFFGSVYVLAAAAAYFTRLVVTDRRLFILQGYEECRSWGLHELPPSLIRFGPGGAAGGARSVDLDALQTMLGSGSDQFSDSKTILTLGKQLEQIKAKKDGRP